jgi:hypothetical protein
MKRIEDELHRIRVAMLDHSSVNYQQYWAAQQALSWVLDPETFAPPFASLSNSEVKQVDCLARSSQSLS